MSMPPHPRVVLAGGWRGYKLPQDRPFKRWEPHWWHKAKARRQAACPHPPERYYGSITAEGKHWMGCCACGKILFDDVRLGKERKEG